MAILAKLHHATRYSYDRPVSLGPQIVRLRPAPHCRTPVLAYSLKIEPENHFINWQQDPHGNYLARLVFPEPTDEFSITVDVLAEMAVYNPFDFFIEDYAQTVPFKYAESLAKDIAAYIGAEPAGPLLKAYMDTVSREADPDGRFPGRAEHRLCSRRSNMSCAWSPACRRRKRPCSSAPAPAATPAGCWSRSCASSASPRASSPAI